MSSTGSTGSPRSVPLRSALRDDSERTPPLSGLAKAVQIAEPDVSAVQQPPPGEELPTRKQFTATLAKRLSGRAAVLPVPSSSRTSVVSQTSLDGSSTYMTSPAQMPVDDPRQPLSPSMRPHIHPLQHQHQHHHQHRQHAIDHISGRLLAQVADWLQHEKVKKQARKARRVRPHGKKTKSPPATDIAKSKIDAKQIGDGTSAGGEDAVEENEIAGPAALPPSRDTIRHHRAPSTGSASSEVSLDRLQRILDDNMAAMGIESIASYVSGLRIGGGMSSGSRRNSRTLRYQPSRTASSDTDYVEGDVLVPSCDAVLDNSKTLKYAATPSYPNSGRAASDAGSISSRREDKERQAWVSFKNEIIRLAHTLRLKGWRKVPLDTGETISVERLSGALTNAVYVVSPPAELGGGGGGGVTPSPLSTPATPAVTPTSSSASLSGGRRSQPSKLLLRIYGPQVEHLIDRETELGVLRRLARKKIGPRLLGTFANGRFEQFFTATTLTAANLREPETSKQIAKRMRELHDGIELLEEELDAGPNVWRNWDRWLGAVESTITYLDQEVLLASKAHQQGYTKEDGHAVKPTTPQTGSILDAWKTRGFVCGIEWPKFKALVDKHRQLVNHYYGDSRRIRDQLVFAHNDTQYGNILRIRPEEKSPLLQPENEHKQLIVIDFEYAAANPPGVEFANHFTEWTYNYHDSAAAHNCNTDRYPTPEQQRRFLRAYVDHRPEFPHQGGGNTPRFGPMALSLPSLPSLPEQPMTLQGHPNPPPLPTASSSSSIVEFMLDARAPPGGWIEEERRREDLVERQVDELMAESRMWRAANSAQWVAWGIVQAKVPGFSLPSEDVGDHGDNDIDGDRGEEEGGHEDEFDYLGYAQERAFFFLGDCIQAGLLRLDELPEDVRARVKLVDY